MSNDADLIGPDDVAFHLELTPPELKIVYYALHAYLDDFGRDEADVIAVARRVLDRLPEAASIRDIPLT